MITRFRIFESLDEPQRGDWCVCDEDMIGRRKFDKKIGIILTTTKDENVNTIYLVKFDDGSNSWFSRNNILFFSNRKIDVKLYLSDDIKKYNL